MTAHFLLSGSAALALVLAGCGGGDGSFSRSAADTAVDVTLRDFAFDGLPPSVSGRKLFVTATNAGPSQHEFEILDAEGRSVDEIAAFDPGKPATLAVRLAPGTYTVQCVLTTPDGKVHADLGMKTSLVVR